MIAAWRGSAPYEVAPSAVPQIADDMPSRSDGSKTHLNSEKSKTTASAVAVGTTYDASGSRVNVNDLPDEMLIKIFSHMSFSELVDVVNKVCSRWRRLSQTPALWVNKEYHIGCRSTHYCHTIKCGATDLDAMQTFCDAPNLCTVRMRRHVNLSVLRALYTNCHRLSVLHLHPFQEITYSVLKNLVENCPRIHTLRTPTELLKSEILSKVVSHLQHLRVLVLDEPENGSTPVLWPLADGCPRLSEVEFGCETLDMNDLKYFLNAKKNILKAITINWTVDGQRSIVPFLAVCAGNLERLQLDVNNILDNEAKAAFTALGSLKNLQELEVVGITKLPPPGALALAFKSGGVPKLTRLQLKFAFGLEDDAVVAICHGCPALQELRIVNAVLLSDAAFAEIDRLQRLEILEVSYCEGLGGCLIPYIATLPRLHTLVLRGMDFELLQPGVSSILKFPSLRCLTLRYCLVTGVPFDQIPGNLTKLRELNIKYCQGDLGGINGLTARMPGLEIHCCIEPEEV